MADRPAHPPSPRELETRLGRSVLAGEIPDGAKIVVAIEKGALTIRHENAR